jgi:hypothetical protein
MATILLVRPANDPVAIELSNWAATLSKSSLPVAITVDLASAAATRAAVDAELPKHELLVFFGHGTPNRLLGASVDLVDSMNVGLVANFSILAVACSSADSLGPIALSKRVQTYLGFKKRLVWITGDPDFKFGPAFCSGPEEMMNHNKMSDALQKMKDELQSVFDFYYSGPGRTSPNGPIGFLTASWDRQHLDLLGNLSYRL